VAEELDQFGLPRRRSAEEEQVREDLFIGLPAVGEPGGGSNVLEDLGWGAVGLDEPQIAPLPGVPGVEPGEHPPQDLLRHGVTGIGSAPLAGAGHCDGGDEPHEPVRPNDVRFPLPELGEERGIAQRGGVGSVDGEVGLLDHGPPSGESVADRALTLGELRPDRLTQPGPLAEEIDPLLLGSLLDQLGEDHHLIGVVQAKNGQDLALSQRGQAFD